MCSCEECQTGDCEHALVLEAEEIARETIDDYTDADVTRIMGELRDRSEIAGRLDYLRGEIEAERISYGEIAELQELADQGHIPEGDTLLLEWAGVPERSENVDENPEPEDTSDRDDAYQESRELMAEDADGWA